MTTNGPMLENTVGGIPSLLSFIEFQLNDEYR